MIVKPFIKWCGGKTRLLPEIHKLLPEYFGTYHEPFLGGGAVFFSLGTEHASLSDANLEIIKLYRTVRNSVEELIEELKTFYYDKELYYAVRAWDPTELEEVQRAARFIFLNKTGFNGLYRVNKKGGFNVPFGKYVNPKILDEITLRACSKNLQGADISCGDFWNSLEGVEKEDLVYLDPPYAPISKTSNFTAYTREGFGESQQKDLLLFCQEVHSLGAYFILSNSDHPDIRSWYGRLPYTRIKTLQLIRTVSAHKRKAAGELLITNIPG